MTGEAGSAPSPPEPARPAVGEGAAAGGPPAGGRSWWQSTAKWLLGALLVIDIGVLLFVLSFANVTADGPAKRSLRHSLAILTEVDAFLDDHFETLRQEAAQTQEETLTLPDFPVQVSFSPEEIRAADREEFRALLLTRAADRIHEEGVFILQEERGGEVSFFSTQGLIRTGMDLLRPTPHRVLTLLTISLASLAGVLALGLALTSRGYGRLWGLGLSVLLAAAPFLIVAVALRFAFRVAADGLDDYLAREFLTLGQELTWAPIRNGIIFSVGGAVIFAAGTALARWRDSRSRF
ncbi:MAG: hypothetical protein A2148_09975 [Chloroflexi bacterium RBG_16_68_14]|nr:MAG: hypothetical protein A2148_09975 [Chloroflexi bacterium RBG_16_68_14]